MLYPYANTIPGLTAAIKRLRASFPGAVTVAYLKRSGIAPQNERYIISVLRFLGVMDDEGHPQPTAQAAFSKHKDSEFAAEFGPMVRAAYQGLFDDHSDAAWQLSKDDLITFFRAADQTSLIIGQRQAATFQALRQLAGHEQPTDTKPAAPAPAERRRRPAPKDATKRRVTPVAEGEESDERPKRESARPKLHIDIQIHIAADATKDQIEQVFASMAKHLYNAEEPSGDG